MSIYRAINGVNKQVTGISRAISGVNQNIKQVQRSISGVNQSVYSSKIYLYNSGDECTDITGGWQGYQRNGTSLIASFDDIQMTSNYISFDHVKSDKYWLVQTKNAVPVTEGMIIKMLFDITSTTSASYPNFSLRYAKVKASNADGVFVNLAQTNGLPVQNDYLYTATMPETGNFWITVSQYYIGGHIKKIWLE